ncbi:hypothetical protein JNM87_03535 [Candidatus Saccharibacteria bacterium]|nr:hypothetical protein [Candidatus Saccharibacteria bacterium]
MNNVVNLDRFNQLLNTVVRQIQADSTFQPNTILALSTGGFPVGAALAKRLGIKSRNVIGLPVYKDDNGDYHLDDRLVRLGDCTQQRILVVDEASKRGLLTKKAVDSVVEHGGMAKSCVLIAWQEGIQPDYVAETCEAEPPDFYWELNN